MAVGEQGLPMREPGISSSEPCHSPGPSVSWLWREPSQLGLTTDNSFSALSIPPTRPSLPGLGTDLGAGNSAAVNSGGSEAQLRYLL